MFCEDHPSNCPVPSYPLPLPGDVLTQQGVMFVEILLLCFAQFLFLQQLLEGLSGFLTNLLPLLPPLPREVALVLLLHGGTLCGERDVGVPQLVEAVLLVVDKSPQPGQQLGRGGLAQTWSPGQEEELALLVGPHLVGPGGAADGVSLVLLCN